MAARALHVELARRTERGAARRPASAVRANDFERRPAPLARRAGAIAANAVFTVSVAALVAARARLGLALHRARVALASARAVAQPVFSAAGKAIVAAFAIWVGSDGDWTALTVRAVESERS
jgi:hypothetical protein